MSKYFSTKSTLKHKNSLFYRAFDVRQCALTYLPIDEEKWEAYVISEGSWRTAYQNVRSIFLPNKIAVIENIRSIEISYMGVLFLKDQHNTMWPPFLMAAWMIARGSLPFECSKFPQCISFCYWETIFSEAYYLNKKFLFKYNVKVW